ncbi:hypothetical protein AHF37_07832 [Paragonimus kellicotti]|nr:hypothetical protein AHF37_07832 [Paragonimus kellicotti]
MDQHSICDYTKFGGVHCTRKRRPMLNGSIGHTCPQPINAIFYPSKFLSY